MSGHGNSLLLTTANLATFVASDLVSKRNLLPSFPEVQRRGSDCVEKKMSNIERGIYIVLDYAKDLLKGVFWTCVYNISTVFRLQVLMFENRIVCFMRIGKYMYI